MPTQPRMGLAAPDHAQPTSPPLALPLWGQHGEGPVSVCPPPQGSSLLSARQGSCHTFEHREDGSSGNETKCWVTAEVTCPSRKAQPAEPPPRPQAPCAPGTASGSGRTQERSREICSSVQGLGHGRLCWHRAAFPHGPALLEGGQDKGLMTGHQQGHCWEQSGGRYPGEALPVGMPALVSPSG